jgi:hypothetical protein
VRTLAVPILAVFAACGSRPPTLRSPATIRHAAAPALRCPSSEVVITGITELAGAAFAVATCRSRAADLLWLDQDRQWEVTGTRSTLCGGTAEERALVPILDR